MIYIGIDVSSKSFVIHAIDGRKKLVFKGEILPEKRTLLKFLKELGDEPKYVVFEAGNQMKWIAQALLKVEDVTLHVVHPNELKWISQCNGKTDKVDARKMAELARGDLLPRKVHIVEGTVREVAMQNSSEVKTNVTAVMIEEHQLILRMISLVEKSATLAEAGNFSDWNFILDAALPFIREYADHFHHAKEEDVLFKALVANGMPEQNSPIAAMLMEHDQGRKFVGGMESAARQLQSNGTGVENSEVLADLIENSHGYASLLRDHIDKEDNILYPLSERVLPESMRPAMLTSYATAEARSPGLQEKYRRLVEEYEAKLGI